MRPGPILYLVGFMGSGKTEVGRATAEAVGWELAETDALVEQDEGQSIRRIFEERGEASFRRAESRVLRAVSRRERLIVATGGGLFAIADNRRIIRQSGRSVWLDVTLDVARSRVGDGTDRPLWAPEGRLEFRTFFERRRAAYALADLRVDASDGAPSEIAAMIVERFSAVFR